MNRKLNVKLLLMLFFGSIAIVVTVHFVHGYQVAKNADGLLKRAETAKESGDLTNSLKYRRRYLIYRRDDYAQLSQYALDMKEMLEQERDVSTLDFRKTYDAIENALQKLKDAEDQEKYREPEEQLRLASVEFAMGYGLWSAAIEHLEYLIQRQGEAADPELQLKLARCQIISGELDEGLRILHQLVGYDESTGTFTQPASDPSDPDAYYLLAIVYRMKVRNDEMAEKVLDRMIEVNPDSFDAYLKRCAYWRSMGELHKEQARADMEKALALGSDEANVLETAAGIELDEDNLDKAKAILDGAVQTFPDEVRFYRLLAAWAAKSNDYDLAREYVAEGLKKVPGNLDLVWYRANLELENSDVDEAKKSLAELKKMQAPPAYIDVMQAQIAMSEMRWLDASTLLERVRPDLTEGASNLLSMVDRGLARCYERLGQSDKMLTAYRNLVLANPEDQTVAWGLIRAMLLMGRVETASNTYRRMADELQLRGEEISTNSLPTLLQLRTAQQLQLPEDQRNWDEANRLIVRIRSEPSIPEADKIKLMVDLLRKRGEMEAAETLLQRARQEHGDDLTFRLAEVDQAYRQNGFDAAWRVLDSLQAELGDSLKLRTARARLIAIRGGTERKPRLLALEKDDDAFSSQDKAALRWTLAQFHYGSNDREEARRLFEQIAEINREDVNVRMTLFELAKEMDNEAEVNARLAELKQLVGSSGAQYQAAEASRIIWRVRRKEVGSESLARARSLVDDARRSRPNWDRLALLEAEIYLLEDDADAAVAVLMQASEGAASSINVKRQLVRLLVGQEQYEAARKVLDTLPEADRSVEEKRIAAAMQGGAGASGPSLAEHANSTNPDDHLADAQRLASAKNWAEAENALLRAVQVGPGRTNTWLSLVSYLASRSRFDEAENVVRQAQLQLPESLVPLFAGQCYELIPGNAELALQFYTRAHNINPEDLFALRALASFHLRARKGQPAYLQKKHLDQARRYLQTLVDVAQRDSTTSQAQAEWARREMARLLAVSGRYPDYLKALKLVDENADAQGNLGPADTLFYAELAAGRRDGASRNRTIQQLQSAQASRSLTNGERLVLAELYAKTNQKWDECRKIMEQMIADHPDDQQVRLLWVEWLLERGETDEAAKLLAALESETPRYKALDAKRLVLQGQSKQAVKVIRSLLPEKLPSDKNEARILLEVATLTDQLARDDASLVGLAENLYRAFAERNPAGRIPLAMFLGRRGGETNLQKAFQFCGEAITEQPPEMVIQMALSIVREHPEPLAADSPIWGQLLGWIDTARRRSPDSIVPVLQRASVEETRGELAAAETLYRQLLDRADLDAFNRAVVSNNLAYLLALEGNGAEALSLVEVAIEQLGPIDDVLDTRAVVHLARNEPQKAKQDLQAVISGGSKSPEVYFHLAQAEQMQGSTEGARAALQRAIGLGLSRGRVKPVERPRLRQLARELGVALSGNGNGTL